MNVYIATSHDPFYNLAVENWLFREVLTDTPILYLWQNEPCVVIGRAQNPWRECNIEALNQDNIPIVRRQSGGGTVYHDLGNLNYTIMSKAQDYNKQGNLQLIVNILKYCGIKAHISPRNDILLNHENTDYKISGSAFRETREKSFHHGTLLINTDTSKLYHYLHHPIDEALETKGVHSKRSTVINLAEVNHKLSPVKITKAFLNQFNRQITFLPNDLQHHLITHENHILRSWQWRFGKTLPFHHTFKFNQSHFKLEIKNGYLIKMESTANIHYQNLINWLNPHYRTPLKFS